MIILKLKATSRPELSRAPCERQNARKSPKHAECREVVLSCTPSSDLNSPLYSCSHVASRATRFTSSFAVENTFPKLK